MKILGHKAYDSITHLPGSRIGSADRFANEGQAKIATERPRDKHDLIIVQEKLDGSNMAVAKVNGEILPLTRSGYLASTSPYQQHHFFSKWVEQNKHRFHELLQEGERICGEWLALAHGTRYKLKHEPFVVFDLMIGKERLIYKDFSERALRYDFILPRLLHMGNSSFSIEQAINAITISGHGAIDEVEGAVWRVERKNKVIFLCKYVHHDKQDGKYFAQYTGKGDVWNLDITQWL